MVQMVLAGKSRTRTAKEIGVATRTVSKWVKRYLADGAAGLQDRSSRPHKLRDQTPAETPHWATVNWLCRWSKTSVDRNPQVQDF